MLSSSETTFSTYPSPGTSLVGRDREIAEVRELLRVARLVTLTGPGGTGKTRLALAVAHELRLEGHEVVFVDLASIDSPAPRPSVDPGSAGAPGPRWSGTARRSSSCDSLSRPRYLLLDNFEHVMAAAPQIAEIAGRGALASACSSPAGRV